MDEHTEKEVRAALQGVADDFDGRFPMATHRFKFQRLVNVSEGSNWAVDCDGVFGNGNLRAFQDALEAVHERMPLIAD